MSTRSVLVEACVTSNEEAADAFGAGADRVELCRNLPVGGLTPDASLVDNTMASVTGPVFVLIRPHADTFRLSPAEVDDLIETVASMIDLGVDGVVVGPLDRDGYVDSAALEAVVQAADGRPVTFHRAFDTVADPLGAAESLIRAGVDRVLTSGGADTAWAGRDVLRRLVQRGGDDLTVLGGGGVRADHVRQLVAETGLREVHARAAAIPEIVDALRDR